MPVLPRVIAYLTRAVTGVEIHPAAMIGREFFIDHGAGVVIGETAVIGDRVTLYQGVTLGGTGFQRGQSSPTMGDNVTVGSGAKLLGPIAVGDGAKVGANTVVVEDVPPGATVVGNPGHLVRVEGRRVEGPDADWIHLPDPIRGGDQGPLRPPRRHRAAAGGARRQRRRGRGAGRRSARAPVARRPAAEVASAPAPHRFPSSPRPKGNLLNKRHLLLVSALLVSTLALVACGSSGSSDEKTRSKKRSRTSAATASDPANCTEAGDAQGFSEQSSRAKAARRPHAEM